MDYLDATVTTGSYREAGYKVTKGYMTHSRTLTTPLAGYTTVTPRTEPE